MMRKGLIHLYYGEGKGKTTAASGLCLRAAGRGLRVLIAQFLKDGNSGEILAFQKSGLPVDVIEGYSPSSDFCERAQAGLPVNTTGVEGLFEEAVTRAVSGDYDLLLLDELTWGFFYNVVREEDVLEFLKNKPLKLEVVMTGRKPPQALIEAADYVSEIRCVRHPFERGVAARKGIEI